MTNAELIQKIRAEIERRHDYQSRMYHDHKPDGRPNDGWAESLAIMGELEELLSFLDTFEKECEDFPTTDEEMAKFLATHPKVEVPEKYKTPDWMFEESEKPVHADLEKAAKEYVKDIPTFKDSCLMKAAFEDGWLSCKDALMEWLKERYNSTISNVGCYTGHSVWAEVIEKLESL